MVKVHSVIVLAKWIPCSIVRPSCVHGQHGHECGEDVAIVCGNFVRGPLLSMKTTGLGVFRVGLRLR